ncbi:hypothetical protein MBLNU459_g2927t1 [Dothideomycetes sp. NU459]
MLGLPTSPKDLGFPTEIFSQYSRPAKRALVVRSLALILAIAFSYVVFTSTTIPAEWKLPVKGFGNGNDNATEQVNETAEAIEEAHAEGRVSSNPHLASFLSAARTGHTTISTVPFSETWTTSLSTTSTISSSISTPTPEPTSAEEEPRPHSWEPEDEEQDKEHSQFVGLDIHSGAEFNVQSALKKVLSLMPDEIYFRQLTTPIMGGGEQRLREVGLRTRLFKDYFKAWESLHIVSDGEDAYVRDNVVQYLRDARDLSEVSSLPKAEIIRQYEEFRYFLAGYADILFPWVAPYFADQMTLHAQMYNAGRGIVLSGANHQAPYMLTAIAVYRKMGCNLPIEVMYLGEDDLSEEYREQMEAFPGVTTRNLKQMVGNMGWNIEGFASKAFSILMSSFREVLFIDADVLFFRNPELLFQEEGYRDTGALFFRDRVVYPAFKKKFLRQILPKPISHTAKQSRYWNGESSEMQESGVLVIDKWRHFVTMLLVARMNGPDRSDGPNGEKGVYSFFYGDKETFWLGFELAGDTDYHFYQGDNGALGVVKEVQRYQEMPELPKESKSTSSDHSEAHTDQSNHDKVNEDVSHDNADNSGHKPQGHEEHHESSNEQKESGHDSKDQDQSQSDTSSSHEESSKSHDDKPHDDKSHDDKSHDDKSHDDKSHDEKSHGESSDDKSHKESNDDKSHNDKSHEESKDDKSFDKSPKDPKDLDEYNIGKSGVHPDDKHHHDESSPSKAEVDANTQDEVHSNHEQSSSEDNEREEQYKRDVGSMSTNLKPVEIVSALDMNMTTLEEMHNVNFTMCSPQLLHLDLSGRPLWFNGWIQEDKFAHDAHVAVSKFEFYTSERLADSPDVFGHWDLGEHNMCCLRTDRIHAFEESEKDILDMIISIARENGAVQ